MFDEFDALRPGRLRAAADHGVEAIERGDDTEFAEGELAGFVGRIKPAGRGRTAGQMAPAPQLPSGQSV